MKRFILISFLMLTACLYSTVVPDGSFDQLFASNGVERITNLGASSDFLAVALQNDEKIVVAGKVRQGATTNQLLVRYNKDGSLDQSFGDQGRVINTAFAITAGNVFGFTTELVMYPDGRLLVADTSEGAGNLIITRYLSNGLVDPTFGSGTGFVTINLGGNDFVGGVALQTDGKIIVVGTNLTTGQDVLIRLNTNGSFDTTFGTNGIVTVSFVGLTGLLLTSVEIDYQGRLVVSGYGSVGGDNSPVVARFLSTGEIDTTFGSAQGYTIVTFVGQDASIFGSLIQADGTILQAGRNSTLGEGLLLRYTKDGLLDATFGNGGSSSFSLPGGTDLVLTDCKVQADGKIVASGSNTVAGVASFLVLRTLPNGLLDGSFGQSGFFTFNQLPTILTFFSSLAIDANNDIVAVGVTSVTPGVVQNATIVRLRVDSLQTSVLSSALWQRYYNQNNH